MDGASILVCSLFARDDKNLIVSKRKCVNHPLVCCFEQDETLPFVSGNLAWNIAKGPLEAVVGLVFGGVVGGLLWFLPSAQSVSLLFRDPV